MRRLFLLVACFAIVHLASPLVAQSWQAQGHGVGLYDNSRADYDKTLRVVQPGTRWVLPELSAQNAFSSNAPRSFGAWLQGPPPSTYLNRNGVPVFLYKVRVTNPRGAVQVFGPHGFYMGGHATFGVGVQGGPFGQWKVEWLLWHRDTQEERVVATDTFELSEAAVSRPTQGTPQGTSVHVGLYDGSRPDYDQTVHVVQPGARWSLKQLAEMSAFNSNGPRVFGSWYQGPHTRTFTNANGIQTLLHKVKVTNPRGQSQEFGPYGFYTPGHATHFLANVQNGLVGTWRVTWYTVHRDTKEEKLVQADTFEMVP